MTTRMRQWTATAAAAAVLTYVGTVAVTKVQDFALWPANMIWLSVASVVCGALLALIGRRATWSMMTASGLATVAFAGLWSYVVWTFVRGYLSFSEFLGSNLLLVQIFPRAVIIFMTSTILGLLGVVLATILFSDYTQRE